MSLSWAFSSTPCSGGFIAIGVRGIAFGAISFLFVSSSTPLDGHSFSATSDDLVGII